MEVDDRTETGQRGDTIAPLLAVHELSVEIQSEDGIVHAVDRVSWSVNRGQVLGIVGESGSGKSVSCLSLVGLLPEKRTTVTGSAMFEGVDLLGCSERQLDSIRGRQIAMIFQDPLTSLHPLMSVGAQLLEAIKLHQKMAKSQARALAIEMLGRVG